MINNFMMIKVMINLKKDIIIMEDKEKEEVVVVEEEDVVVVEVVDITLIIKITIIMISNKVVEDIKINKNITMIIKIKINKSNTESHLDLQGVFLFIY